MHTRQAVFFAAFVLSFVSAAAGAAPIPNGPAVKVSSCDTCKKRSPAVAGTAAGPTTGAFQVTWESTTAVDPLGISARFFTKTGAPRSSDLQVNSNSGLQQSSPAVASDALGNYVVAWSEVSGANGNSDVLVQRYTATGARDGAAILVNVDDPAAPEPAIDIQPAVARAADGSFVVAWIRYVNSGPQSPAEDPAVWVRRYTKTGTPLGPPVKLSTGLVQGNHPDLCIDTTGRAVVVWTSVDTNLPFEPNLKGVSLRRVSPAGAALDAELIVAPPLSTESSATVACGAGGTFAVAWSTDQAPAMDDMDIVAQRFTTLARRNGKAFRINSTTAGQQSLPAMAMDATGNFVVVWQSRLLNSSSADSIHGRRFLASATADGNDFIVHTRAGVTEDRPMTPDVANLGPAGFVVIWLQGTSKLQAQRYKLTP